jgi:hypothetical protein
LASDGAGGGSAPHATSAAAASAAAYALAVRERVSALAELIASTVAPTLATVTVIASGPAPIVHTHGGAGAEGAVLAGAPVSGLATESPSTGEADRALFPPLLLGPGVVAFGGGALRALPAASTLALAAHRAHERALATHLLLSDPTALPRGALAAAAATVATLAAVLAARAAASAVVRQLADEVPPPLRAAPPAGADAGAGGAALAASLAPALADARLLLALTKAVGFRAPSRTALLAPPLLHAALGPLAGEGAPRAALETRAALGSHIARLLAHPQNGLALANALLSGALAALGRIAATESGAALAAGLGAAAPPAAAAAAAAPSGAAGGAAGGMAEAASSETPISLVDASASDGSLEALGGAAAPAGASAGAAAPAVGAPASPPPPVAAPAASSAPALRLENLSFEAWGRRCA